MSTFKVCITLYNICYEMDSKFFIRIVKFTEGLTESKLSKHEKKKLLEFVDANYEFVKDKRDVIQVAELATEFVNDLEKSNESTPDEKEYLTDKKLNLVSFLGLDTFDKFITAVNPQAKKKKAYMCLDSRYARFNSECTRLTWDFINNLNVVNNSTNVIGPVRDITWIRMQPFYMMLHLNFWKSVWQRIRAHSKSPPSN
jgi:hypothetical protein